MKRKHFSMIMQRRGNSVMLTAKQLQDSGSSTAHGVAP